MSYLPLTSGTAVVSRLLLYRCPCFVIVVVTKAGLWSSLANTNFPLGSLPGTVSWRLASKGQHRCSHATLTRRVTPQEKGAIASWKLAHSSAFGRSIFVLLLLVKARIMSIGKGNNMVLVRSVAILVTV